ncbi:MAG: N-acetyl-gamma-glutamyl-phosphate reductase, partial [Chloroflexi bacterium]|nr:N-acetyl-gamma-glutamyl-phosphate reductase [Chloroflexota bacterium]
RHCRGGHPAFEVVYASGETTAGQRLAQQFPALAGQPTGTLVIQPLAPDELHGVDVLFASLPTGKSREPLARVPREVKIVDVGGDHRFVEGWTYGLTELPGARAAIARSSRVSDPGCYPAAALIALAPLVAGELVEPEGLVVDAKTGVSGAGRGGGTSAFGYAETNEDVMAYALAEHPHAPEMQEALTRLAGRRATVAFTPHLVPMTRGILATCYARPRGTVTAAGLEEAARALYRDEPFVRVVPVQGGRSPRTKWATGSNVVFVSYAINRETGLVLALAALDNLGKGAAGQAVQNANLMTGQPETAGLAGLPLWP